MLSFSHSRIRSRAACLAAGLFVWAQTAVFAQNFGARLQAVVTETDVYLPGSPQMIAPANADEVMVNPQGRYALIVQQEAALPPGGLIGQSNTGAIFLLLYDAKLHKTRTLWSRRADETKHFLLDVNWLRGSNCAVVVAFDSGPLEDGKMSEGTSRLLFFNFDKSLSPRVLVTTATALRTVVSPNKPFFVVQDDQKYRMGSAPLGALGPVLTVPPRTFLGYSWDAEGTSVYGLQSVPEPKTENSKPTRLEKWFLWDGKAAQINFLGSKPKDETMARERDPAVLPITLRTGTLPVPANPQKAPPPIMPAKAEAAKTPPQTAPPAGILHPLFLEAANAPKPDAKSKNAEGQRSALLAPDADKSYLLPDQSAVLYQSGGAVYAVPLVRINAAEYAAVQKAKAMQDAKQVALGIMMYTQDYDEEFPLQNAFTDGVKPYLRNDALFNGFTYQSPGVPLGKVASPRTTIMGYLAAPGGRAVVYVDGHVQWEDKP